MKILLFPLRVIYLIYAISIFTALMILVFIWALIVSPFGRIRGGNLIYYGCIIWAETWLALVFIFHKNIHLDARARGASFIYVANHISYLDSAVIPATFHRPIRPLGKVEMTKIPVFGFIYKNAIVTVDRSSAANRANSVRILKSILSKEISILVFPEGTFNTTGKPLREFYDGAFKIAIETNTPIKPVLFLDTHKRMHYRSIFSLTPGRSRSLFLPEVSVDGYSMENIGSLKERVFNIMEEALIKYS